MLKCFNPCRRLAPLLWTALAVVATSSHVGCASGAKPDRMVPLEVTTSNQFPHAVRVAVSGGSRTNPMWASKIAAEDFREALVGTIESTRLFAGVTDGDEARYALTVNLLGLDQQLAGLSLGVALSARWQLKSLPEGEEVWEEFISTEYTAGVGESLYAVARLRKANEGAARANIAEGVQMLSQINLP